MILDKKSGWWLPEGERHLQAWMHRVNDPRDGRLLYQGAKYRRAIRYVPRKRVAVDIGAHVGLWSWQMAKDFDFVNAFEPMPEHRDCYAKNMEGMTNFHLYPVALGPENGTAHVRTRTVGSSGDTGVDPTGAGLEVEMKTVDSFDFQLIDFMKIDCEGYELFVLQGAIETLKRCKPVIIVEQKPETGMEKTYGVGTTDAVKFLEHLGAKRRDVLQGDYIMTW